MNPDAAAADGRVPIAGARSADPSPLTAAVAAAQGGDETAFVTVYRAVHPPLVRYLRVLVGPDAEDVASDTWVSVCRDLGAFRGDGNGFRGWVATIGRHRAIDHLRARGRRPADPVPTESLTGLVGDADTEQQALDLLSTDAAVALIASLPTEQAEAVMLRAVVGLDAATAGRVLGKRAGAVRTAAHRGLKTLARRLESGEGGRP